jgi:transketolase
MRDAFIARLGALAASDSRIMLVTGDLGFGVLDEFERRFPKQYVNAGVAEQNMTGLATGLALEGRIVFTYSIGNFPTLRCLEQVRNDAAYHEANVKIVAIGGGFSYGALGMSHHATEDLAILRAIPGITVVAPGDDWEAVEATSALAATPGTCYLRLDRSAAPSTHREGEVFTLGRARVLRDGDDATIIVTGGLLGVALQAGEALDGEGLRTRVVSMHTIRPIDREAILAACRETAGIVTFEEHVVDGGLGGAVAEVCADANVYPRMFRRVGLRDGFSSIVGSQEYLRERYGIDATAVCEAVRAVASAVDVRAVPGA